MCALSLPCFSPEYIGNIGSGTVCLRKHTSQCHYLEGRQVVNDIIHVSVNKELKNWTESGWIYFGLSGFPSTS